MSEGGPAGLPEAAGEVDARLAAWIDALPAPAPRLRDAMRYSLVGGGKRLRAVLCRWAGEELGGADDEALWAAALALEAVHAYSLVHDDLPAMDDDDLRRGRPSCHRQFDEATAILAGDTLQSEAFALLARVEPAALSRGLVAELAAGIGLAGMASGQQLDLEAAGRPADAEHMRRIHRLKTGRLLGVSLALGARCAGARAPTVDNLRAAGEDLGLAFQVVDDLLDEEAPSARTGKSPGKDRAQGKLTAVASLGTEGARDEASRLLRGALAALAAEGLGEGRLAALCRRLVERDR